MEVRRLPCLESKSVAICSQCQSASETQIFINFKNNGRLDGMGFAPFGQIDAAGMKVVDSLYSGYGEGAPRGRGPSQGRIKAEGNRYLKAQFPQLDYIKRAVILP